MSERVQSSNRRPTRADLIRELRSEKRARQRAAHVAADRKNEIFALRAQIESKKMANENLARELARLSLLRTPLAMLDEALARLHSETKVECSTALAYALTYLDQGREYLAFDRRAPVAA